MAEEAVIDPKTEIKKEAASMGSVQRITVDTKVTPDAVILDTKEEAPAAAVITDPAATAVIEEVAIKPSELTKEQIAELYTKNFPTPAEQTEAEKKQDEISFEKRMIDLFIDGGGTPEQYGALKTVANMDLKELSRSTVIKELKDRGVSDDLISEVLTEQYYQVNPDELEQSEDETDDQFKARKEKIVKKVAFGTSRFEAKGKRVKESAESTFNTLKSKIEAADLVVKTENDTIAKIDELSKTLPKKITLELGKLKDKPLGSVDINVSDEEINEVIAELKDPAKRKQLLYNEDNTINVKGIAELMLRNKQLEKAAREGFQTGTTKNTEVWESIFPGRNPNSIGLGGAPASFGNNEKGKVVSAGKPQRANAGERR